MGDLPKLAHTMDSTSPGATRGTLKHTLQSAASLTQRGKTNQQLNSPHTPWNPWC
jgi:hypothetical protein